MQLRTWIPVTLVLWTFMLGTAAPALEKTGTLQGMVVNRTHGDSLVAGAEVILRIRHGGRSAVAASTTTDRYGAFRFDDLPLGTQWVYLPGANQGTVHHPGPRVELTEERPRARVQIAVYEEVSGANPLVIAEHTIVIQPDRELLRVSESLVVENPSLACYIGQQNGDGNEPVTLRLVVPEGVQRVTFDEEFFGRRFTLDEDQLVTTIPWPPGRREIGFCYAVPAKGGRAEWARRLDVPCSKLQLTVRTDESIGIESSLQLVQRDATQVVYGNESAIPPGKRVYIAVHATGVPLSVYGRWLSLATLLALVAVTSTLLVLRKHRAAQTVDSRRGR